jgi:predicted phage terminase large subunit-like protein
VNEAQKLSITKAMCEDSHLFFTRYFFKHRQGVKFKVNWHHHVISNVIDDIIKGKRKNVVINIPPGSSKTEMVSINFMARGLALNPWSRFLHISYSDDLASTNSHQARELVESEEFQALWPMKIAVDSKSKKKWNVLEGERIAGGAYAVALGGQITGFRAGRMEPDFQGAIIIDDPLKPEDAFSKTKRDAANRKLLSTVKSRKANPETPIIVIMQRLAEDDPTGFIKKGNLGDDWEFITIPAIIDDAYVKTLEPKIAALVDSSERDEQKRFSYWPYKEPIKDLIQMESGAHEDKEGSRMSRHVFAGQYGQNPIAIGGNLIRGEWFGRYKMSIPPRLKSRYMFADTASKTKERNDFSVFEVWGEGYDGRIYLLDLLRGKWEAPELEKRALAFWNKHKAIPEIADMGSLRYLYVEDKSSGTGLIQTLRSVHRIPVKEIQRSIDKYTRCLDAQPYIEAGSCVIPEDAPYTSDFILEGEAFSADGTHAHDDQLDPMFDAINMLLSNKNNLKKWENLS